MKYIRTKDGIFDLSRFKFEKGDINQSKVGSKQDCYWEQHDIEYCHHRCIWVKDIIKQADTIEELCDEFAIKWGNGSNCETLMKSFNQAKYWITQDANAKIFGAIWTDKGLIYVAKMNEKGELELL